MSNAEHLRELSVWFRDYAERPAPIDTWDNWLRVADALEADAMRLEAGERETRPGALAVRVYALGIFSMITIAGAWSSGIAGAALGMVLGIAIIISAQECW